MKSLELFKTQDLIIGFREIHVHDFSSICTFKHKQLNYFKLI